MNLWFKVPENMNEMVDPEHFVVFPCIKRQSDTVPNIKSDT